MVAWRLIQWTLLPSWFSIGPKVLEKRSEMSKFKDNDVPYTILFILFPKRFYIILFIFKIKSSQHPKLNFYDLSSPKGSSELNATSFLICYWHLYYSLLLLAPLLFTSIIHLYYSLLLFTSMLVIRYVFIHLLLMWNVWFKVNNSHEIRQKH
jgi:hypothetical protein